MLYSRSWGWFLRPLFPHNMMHPLPPNSSLDHPSVPGGVQVAASRMKYYTSLITVMVHVYIYIYNYTSCNCRDHNSNSESCYNVLTFFLSGGSPPTIVCIVKEQQVIHAHMVECERLTQVINGQKNHSKTRAAMIPTDSSPATTPTTVPVSNCKQ